MELNVRMLNINYGYNKRLMEQCKVLEEYSRLTAITQHGDRLLHREWNFKRSSIQEQSGGAGDVLEEFDAEKYERTIREEGRAAELKEGLKEGFGQGEAGRSNDFLKFLSDRELQKRLFIEFGLEE